MSHMVEMILFSKQWIADNGLPSADTITVEGGSQNKAVAVWDRKCGLSSCTVKMEIIKTQDGVRCSADLIHRRGDQGVIIEEHMENVLTKQHRFSDSFLTSFHNVFGENPPWNSQ